MRDAAGKKRHGYGRGNMQRKSNSRKEQGGPGRPPRGMPGAGSDCTQTGMGSSPLLSSSSSKSAASLSAFRASSCTAARSGWVTLHSLRPAVGVGQGGRHALLSHTVYKHTIPSMPSPGPPCQLACSFLGTQHTPGHSRSCSRTIQRYMSPPSACGEGEVACGAKGLRPGRGAERARGPPPCHRSAAAGRGWHGGGVGRGKGLRQLKQGRN